MKTTNQIYYALNSSLMQSPRYVVEIAYDFASTDLVYFTSHSDTQYPVGATVIENVIADNGLSGTSQKLNPLEATASIGTMTIKLLDYEQAITSQIGTKLATGYGLKGKRVRVYRGFEGIDWADYELFQTQIVDSVSIDNGVYTIKCADVQRSQRKNIFDVKETNLTASVGISDTLIPCSSYDAFVMLAHGTAYSDAPSSTVGYIKIDDEVIRYSGYTVDGTLGPCFVVDTAHSRGRGALGTAPEEHEVDSTASSDRRKTIEEFIYLEMPLVKLAYAILTGTLYGDAASLPDHWHLNISTDYVATSEFVFIGSDWWTVSDDTKGRIGRFAGLSKEDGKKFLEKEIYQLLGAYSPVLSDGQLGLRRLNRVLFDSSPVDTIGKNEIISHSELMHDMREVENQIQINWNYDFVEEETTRSNLIVDAGSISTHGPSPVRTLTFKGLHGSRHTLNTLYEHFGTLRDRYAGPPQTIKVTLLGRNHLKEVGDIIQLKHPDIQDFVTGTSIDRAFEVQQVSIDWSTGRVSLDLFGSSQAAGLDALSTADVLIDTFYTSSGTNIESFPGVTNISGVIHVTSNLDITGSIGTTDATAAGSIVYANGPLQIDSSVTLTCKLNTQIRAKGHIQVDGTIITKGRGFTGATAAAVPSANNVYDLRWYTFTDPTDPGVPTVGTTASQGGVVTGDSNAVYHGRVYSGTIQTLPYFIVENNNGVGINGLPQYLVGVAGSSGGHSAINGGSSSDTFIKGGNGGNSGGGLLFVCRGFDVGAGGLVDVSGNDGGQGTSDGVSASGAGAGGHPGGVVIFLDGPATYPTGLSRVKCWRGISPYIGTPIFPNQSTDHPSTLVSSAYEESALSYYDASSSMVRVQYIPDYQAAESDVKTYADVPTAINIVELVNTPQTPASNLASLEISVTPPVDSVYLYSDIYYKLPTQDAWIYVGPADSETVAVVPMDGTTYDIKAVPVSIVGAVSTDYITDSVTVSNQAGGVYLDTGNYIAYAKTDYTDDVNNGFWIGVNDLNFAQLNIGDSVDNLKWDGVNLSITGNISATSGTIGNWVIETDRLKSSDGIINLIPNSGIYVKHPTLTSQVSITPTSFNLYDATIGATVFSFNMSGTATMAGWTLDNTAFTSPNGRVVLDAANNQLIAYGVNPLNYVRMTGTELRGVDSILGTTFLLPTDGSPPQFSSGVIMNTEYQLYTASVIKTAVDPTTTGGVLMNDTGVHVFNSSGVRTAFLDAINSNHEFSGQITVDWTTDVLGTNLPESNATVGADSTNLKTGPGTNMLFNPGFREGYDGWYTWSNQTTLITWGIDFAADWTIRTTSPEYGTLYIKEDSGPRAGAASDFGYSNIPVIPGKRYEASFYAGALRCTVVCNVIWRDINGTQIGQTIGQSIIDTPNGGKTLSEYQRIGAFSTAPSNAVTASLIVRKYATSSGSTDSYLFACLPYFGEAYAAQTEYSVWVDGSTVADITANNTSLDTSNVDGVSASTVISNINQAIADAATAQATADGKIETFFQATPPTASGYGDIWFDTDDGYRIYTWNGSAWVDSQDTDIALAIADASTAQATADGKITTFYSSTTPTAEAIGDLWFNTATFVLSRWSGTVWLPVSDSTEPVLELGVTINAGGITLGSGGAIKGGQTDYNVGTGYFLGYSGGGHKLSIGNPVSQGLTWNGSALTVKGDLVISDWSTNVTGTNLPSANADVTDYYSSLINNDYALDLNLDKFTAGALIPDNFNGDVDFLVNTYATAQTSKILHIVLDGNYIGVSISGQIDFGSSDRYESSCWINISFTTDGVGNFLQQNYEIYGDDVSSILKVYVSDPTWPTITVYVAQEPYKGFRARLSVVKTTANINVWHVGTAETPSTTNFTPTINRDVQDGADVTLSAINGGLVVTAGFLTGGTNTVRLDYANKRVTIGNETYGSDGIQLEYNAGNPRAYIGNGSTNYLNFDGTTLNLKGIFSSTGAAGTQRIEINPGNDNEMHFYGDRGDSTVEELATVGISTIGSDTIILNLGSVANSRICLFARGTGKGVRAEVGGDAVSGVSSGGVGLFGSTTRTNHYAVRAYTIASGSSAVSAYSGNGDGIYAIGGGIGRYGAVLANLSTGSAPLRIVPMSSVGPPTASADIGAIEVDSAGVVWVRASAGWTKVGAQ